MLCEICGRPLEEEHWVVCSACNPRATSGLARTGEDALDRAVVEALSRSQMDSMLARSGDAIGELTRDVEIGSLALSELDAALLADTRLSALADLEDLLARTNTGGVLEGLALADLLDRRGGEMATIRKGLALARAKRYPEAVEWWSLHRQQTEPSQGRLQVLYLLLETVTCTLGGDRIGASRAARELKGHAWYVQRQGASR